MPKPRLPALLLKLRCPPTLFQALTCGCGGRSRCSRSGAAAGHAGCGESRGGGRSGPSARGARGHPARPRPWRPSRPRHRVCRGNGRRRSRGSPWCSGPEGCRRRPRGRTSRRPSGACPGTYGRSGCPPWGTSCPPRPAEGARSSWRAIAPEGRRRLRRRNPREGGRVRRRRGPEEEAPHTGGGAPERRPSRVQKGGELQGIGERRRVLSGEGGAGTHLWGPGGGGLRAGAEMKRQQPPPLPAAARKWAGRRPRAPT